MLTRDWYEKIYSAGNSKPSWDIGRPHCGITELLDDGRLSRGRVLVPGCGLGRDAILLAERGFEVVVFDFSIHAIRRAKQNLRERRGLKIDFVVEDIYILPESYHGAFDYVVEIGNFQAMSVKERRNYVRVMHQVLTPRGKCIVICKKYPPLTPGPPGLKKASLASYFSTGFKVEAIDPVLMYRDRPPRDGLRLIGSRRKRIIK
jgi:cyclopropane fatty-acyl-phospholipid synthase-like methyltransferase